MSLIDEALKRARMEAAQKAAEGEGLPYPSIPRHLAPRRRRAWLAPAVVAAAVLLGLLVGWAIASRGPRGELTAGGDGAVVAEPPASGPTAPVEVGRDPLPTDAGFAGAGPAAPIAVAPDPALTAPPPAPRSSTAPPADLSPAAPPAELPSVGPPAELPSVDAPAESPAGGPPPPTTTVTDPDSGVFLVLPDRPRSAAEEAAGEPPAEPTVESHVQRLSLPGGGAIELGGIAWSETGPFALLNGRVVGPGARIEGYTLERIRPGHVELVGDGRRVQLSLQ